MQYSLWFDRLVLQANLRNEEVQKEILAKLIHSLQAKFKFLTIKSDVNKNEFINYHNVFTAGKKIFDIKTGIYLTGNYKSKTRIKVYYISIEFAGTRQYTKFDIIAHNCLQQVCGFLNSHGCSFFFTGMDVCLDMECPFYRAYVFCNKKASGIKYYKVDDPQPYATTRYIEKYNKTHKRVMRRSYLYDKVIIRDMKEVHITRFEIKLQARYFNKTRHDTNTIMANLDRYHILYFPTADDKIAAIERYRANEATIRRRDLHKLDLERYRIKPDIKELMEYLERLYEIEEDDNEVQ